jgi:DNA-binding NarL/FixJ family response regulator
MASEMTAAVSRVMIVDDHPIVREGLSARIGAEPDFEVCGEAHDIPSAIRVATQTRPDLGVIDVSLKDGNGVDLIKRLKAKALDVKLLVWSMHDESLYAERALRAGAMGYVNKAEPADQLIDALRRVREGKLFLSPAMTERLVRGAIGGSPEGASPIDTLSERELDVFRRLGQGRSIAEIARELHISPKTAETYRDRIRAKLHVQGGPELIRTALLWVLENG